MKYLRFIRSLKDVEAPVALIFKWILTLMVLYFVFTVAKPAFARGGGDSMFGLSLTLVLSLGIYIMWRNAIIDFISSPLTGLFTGDSQSPDKKPYYSTATARRKRGQYYEAIAEVRRQLDKFPNDFEGVLLLAGIEAENMKDLQAAENTLNRFCDRPETPHRAHPTRGLAHKIGCRRGRSQDGVAANCHALSSHRGGVAGGVEDGAS